MMRVTTRAGVWLIAITIGGIPGTAQEGVTCGITYGPDGNMINLGRDCGNHPDEVFHFAAVAISASTLSMGSSHGQNSQSAAEGQALQVFRSNGGKNCVIAYWSRNDYCVALASTARVPGAFGAALAANRSGAASSAVAQCTSRGGKECVVRVTACGNDDVRWPSPLPLPPGNQPHSVDPNIVGMWSHLINPGDWVLEIGPNGTYTFHSEAADGLPPTIGTFTASNGRYIMHSTNVQWDDVGTYSYQAPRTLVMTGKLGTGTWQRIGPASHR
jgi:hypothetical protein